MAIEFVYAQMYGTRTFIEKKPGKLLVHVGSFQDRMHQSVLVDPGTTVKEIKIFAAGDNDFSHNFIKSAKTIMQSKEVCDDYEITADAFLLLSNKRGVM